MVDVGVDEKALTHLVEKVLVADAHAPVTLALEKAGVRTASDLVSLKLDPDVPLKYDRAVEGGNKVEKNIPLLQAEMRQIIGIQEYIQYYSKNVSHKFFESLDDWEELTAKNFISFRINIAPFLPPDVTPAVVTQPSPATSNLCDWEKGVKPDMSIFRELKNVKEWDQWDTQFRANVSTQGLSSVLDSNFRPQTFKDKVLFHEQQQYLYAVFVRILKTDEGKAIACKYKSTFDAQSIYRELQEYATNSTQAVIDSNTLLQYITTACIVDGSWNGMTEQFVLHWMEQVRLYQDLVDPTAVLVDAVKVSLISDAVRGHPKLSGVYNVAAQLASQPGQHVDYDQYVNLLLSECAQVDSAIARSPCKAVKCSAVKCSAIKCSVYMSDLAINDGEDDALQFSVENEANFNIDSDPMTLMANAHRRREIWDQYSDEDKAVMLSKPATVVMRPNQPSNERELSKSATGVMRRDQLSNERERSSHKVNVHDTTVYDSIVANAHLLDYGEATDDAEDDAVRTEVDKSNDEEAQTLHGFLASHGNNSSPADVRNVLSTLLKRVPGKLPKDHQANAHITYAMDKCHMDKPGSLIDHGANGGMAGADEWEMLPHVHWTRDSDWDPAILNHEFGDNDDEWDDPVMDHRDLLDKVGNYRNRQGVDAGEVHSSRQIDVTISRLHFQARQVRPGEQDWETLCRLFGWAKHYKDAYGVS